MKLVRNEETGKVKWLEATEQELWEADDASLGICLKCGETEEDRCEPDAKGYECSHCGAKSLCSPTMLVMAGRVKIV